MLDMMSPVIREADSVAQELLDILLVNLIEPHKVNHTPATAFIILFFILSHI